MDTGGRQETIVLWIMMCPLPLVSQIGRHNRHNICCTYTHTHTHLTALCPGLPGWAGTRKATPIWILLKQETVSGSVISWAVCKSAPRSRQITTLTPHHSVFYRPDALPAAKPTASKHWRHDMLCVHTYKYKHLIMCTVVKLTAWIWGLGK